MSGGRPGLRDRLRVRISRIFGLSSNTLQVLSFEVVHAYIWSGLMAPEVTSEVWIGAANSDFCWRAFERDQKETVPLSPPASKKLLSIEMIAIFCSFLAGSVVNLSTCLISLHTPHLRCSMRYTAVSVPIHATTTSSS